MDTTDGYVLVASDPGLFQESVNGGEWKKIIQNCTISFMSAGGSPPPPPPPQNASCRTRACIDI